MLDIIRERTVQEEIEYRIEFSDEDGCGFSFPSDEHGNIQFDDTNPELGKVQRDNYDYAMANPEIYTRQYAKLTTRKYTVVEPAVGKCPCGAEVELVDQYQGACSCSKCGQWYNLFGQELLNPELWEE